MSRGVVAFRGGGVPPSTGRADALCGGGVPPSIGRAADTRHRAILVSVCVLALLAGSACRPEPAARVRVATTTSVENSGLLEHLRLAILEEKGIALEALAVGSGKAIALARAGSVDLAITHDPGGEAQLAKESGVVAQRTFLENRFVVVGPEEDPAGVASASTLLDAFRRIHAAGAPFVSRGDESGTHVRELELWRIMGIDPRTNPQYRSLGQGMSSLLRSASELEAYTLTDDATFARVAAAVRLVPLAEAGERARNIYSVTLLRGRDGTLNPAAETVFAWLTSEAGGASVRRFRISGRQFFRPLVPLSDGG